MSRGRAHFSVTLALTAIVACGDGGLASPSTTGLDGGEQPAQAGRGADEAGLDEAGPDDAAADANIHADASIDAGGGTGDSGTPPTGVFVSSLTGDDANPGTAAAPVSTIARGMQLARALGGRQDVNIGEGDYPLVDNLVLAEGISLSGGYLCDAAACTWTVRDAVGHPSKVRFLGNTVQGSVIGSSGIIAGADITRATRVEYLDVVARRTGGFIACITLEGGSPTIANDRLELNAGDPLLSGSSTGIKGTTSSELGPLIRDNLIVGGSARSGAVGVDVVGSVEIVHNSIFRQRTSSGDAFPHAIIISEAGANHVVRNNLITNGSAYAWVGLAGHPGRVSGGALLILGRATVDGNRFNMDGGEICMSGRCCAIHLAAPGVTITNNVIIGPPSLSSCGLWVTNQSAATPTIIAGNFLSGGGDPARVNDLAPSTERDNVPNESAALVLSTTAGVRIRNNILVGGAGLNRYGIMQYGVAGPDSLEAVDFFFASQVGTTDTMYWLESGVRLTTLGAIASTVATSTPPTNLFAVDPKVDATFHLLPGSPMVDVGVLADAPAKDMDDDPRPKGNGIDIGPDER